MQFEPLEQRTVLSGVAELLLDVNATRRISSTVGSAYARGDGSPISLGGAASLDSGKPMEPRPARRRSAAFDSIPTSPANVNGVLLLRRQRRSLGQQSSGKPTARPPERRWSRTSAPGLGSASAVIHQRQRHALLQRQRRRSRQRTLEKRWHRSRHEWSPSSTPPGSGCSAAVCSTSAAHEFRTRSLFDRRNDRRVNGLRAIWTQAPRHMIERGKLYHIARANANSGVRRHTAGTSAL